MSINGIGGVSSYNSYSSMNRKVAMKSVPLPEFGRGIDTILTKTETNRTDEEIKNDIIELAKKDAARGVHGGSVDNYGKYSNELKNLVGEYVGSVSPDRRAIFPAAIAQLGKATTAKLKMPIIDTSLLDLMISGTKVSLKNAAVGYNERDRIMEIGHVEFTVNGENIGSYDKGRGWHYSFTKAEQSRNEEINLLYTRTWAAERKAMGITE